MSSRKWNRGRNGLHQLGQPVAPSILFPGRRFISPVCTSTRKMVISSSYELSKLHVASIREYPDEGEMIEIAKWANKGKSFMHMYLCSLSEGGTPNMVVADKKATPLPKRVLLMCTIS